METKGSICRYNDDDSDYYQKVIQGVYYQLEHTDRTKVKAKTKAKAQVRDAVASAAKATENKAEVL